MASGKRRLLSLGIFVAFVAVAFIAPGVASADSVSGALTSTDPTQTGRLTRDDPESTCALAQPQALFDSVPRHYDAFTFVNPNATTTCMTVTFNALTCVGTQFLQSAAYVPLFNRADILQNVVGDIGGSPNPIKTYSFNVPGSAKFDVVVNEVTANALCPGYSFTVTPGVLPAFSISDVSIGEGNAGTTNAVFTVTLATSASQTTSVDFSTADGTAAAGADYTATSGTAVFAPGETTKTIAVPVVGETLFETTETFSVNLANPSYANIGDGAGVGTIINDDAAPPPPPIVRCRVPRVIGLRLATARTRIRARNCRVGRIRRVASRRSRVGRVIRQTPRAGAVRARNFRVNLVIGRRR